jgi:hypothetical protein
MTPSEQSSGDRFERPYVEADEVVPPPAADRTLMERVLAETLAAADEQGYLHPEELANLRQVARRHVGKPLQCEPMVIELVQSLLATRLPSLASDADRWQPLTAQIAETLWEDDASRDRLHSLWRHLNESEAI